MATLANPTPEQRAAIEAARRGFKAAKGLPPPPERFRRKMQDQAETNAALRRPGPARDAYLAVESSNGSTVSRPLPDNDNDVEETAAQDGTLG